MVTIEEGRKIVKFARRTIENYLLGKELPKDLGIDLDNGVFVTLEKRKELRGCIGFIEAYDKFENLLREAAIAAATQDPRFPPVSIEEMKEITIEVSILSKPKPLEQPYEKNIKIGRDGLIIYYGFYSGLLLPIVAVEEKWNEVEFLENVCLKAGLPSDTWKDKNAKIFVFSTQVFKEKTPNGEVEEIILK
ncbi:MAG: TIGR00296 family protein [Candidatus Micrarchaeia archaeon]|jgi:uncharacterized protein (TIGR00296 family)